MKSIAAIDEAIGIVTREFPVPGYVDLNLDSYRTIAHVALRYLPRGSRVLDIGSGPCDKAAVLSRLGFVCSAVDDLQDPWHKDPATRHKIVAFAQCQGVRFTVADATAAAAAVAGERFDMVMINDVIEHLHDSPRRLLEVAVSLLRPGGILLVTVPNAANLRKRLRVLSGKTNLPDFEGYYRTEGPWRGHVREYVRGDLQLLARFLDVEVLELKGVNHMLHRLPGMLRTPFVHLTKVADGLRDTWLLVARRREWHGESR